tara:strand:+ start:1503 stop:1676 length:174 start_codon:yes stop_codon:yes gene_type:complete
VEEKVVRLLLQGNMDKEETKRTYSRVEDCLADGGERLSTLLEYAIPSTSLLERILID